MHFPTSDFKQSTPVGATETTSNSKISDLDREYGSKRNKGIALSFNFPLLQQVANEVKDVHERNNWLIHQLYVRKEYAACSSVVEAQLRDTNGLCEYALHVKGLLKRMEGALLESLSLLQTAALIAPRNLANRKQVGRAFFLCGLHEEAIAAFEEAEVLAVAQGSAEDWEIQYSIGECYMRLQQHEKAFHAFTRSLNIQHHDKTTLQLAQALICLKDYKSAIQVCEEALKTSPSSSELFEMLGKLCLHEGRAQEAFQCFNTCLRLDPSNEQALVAVSSVIQGNKQYDVALSRYRVLLERMPDSPEVWSNIGACFFGQKNYDAAVACLRKSLVADPFEWTTHYNLCTIYLSMGRYVSAFHHISACITLNVKYAPSYMLLGICLSFANDIENACEAYDKAISLRDDLTLRINYAVTLLNNSMMEQASKQFQAAMSIWNSWSSEQHSEFGASLLNTIEALRCRLVENTALGVQDELSVSLSEPSAHGSPPLDASSSLESS